MALDAGHTEDMDAFVSDVQRAKQISQQRKLHEKDFMKAWDEKNTKQWKENLARGKARREKEKNDILKKTSTIQQARFESSQEHRHSALVGIGEFEETLKREMLKNDGTDEGGSGGASAMFKTAGGQPGTGVPALTYMNPDTLQAGLVQTQKTLKERHDEMVVRQQLHMRRRKRYVREKEARQAKQLYSGVESDIAEQLLSMNRSESIERLARSRVLIHTDLMRENARNRAIRAAALTEEFTEKERVWKQLQAAREVQWVVAPRIAAQAERLARLEASAAAATSCDTHDFIASIVDRVLDVTDWAVCCRLLGSFSTTDGEPLPAALWADAMAMCAESSLPVPHALPRPEPCNVFEHLPFSLCARPLCSDQGWVAASPFTGQAIMALDSPEDCQVSAALARRDAAGFISDVAAAELPGADTVVASKEPVFNDLSAPAPDAKEAAKGAKKGAKDDPPPEEAPAVPPYIAKTKTLVSNPAWIFETPARNLLGNVVVQCRAVAEPLPEAPPLPRDAVSEEQELCPPPPLPPVLRVALCGPSDSLRRKLSAAMRRQLAPAEMALINVHDLVKDLSVVEAQSPCAAMAALSEGDAEGLRRLIFTDVCEGGFIADSTYVQIASTAISCVPEASGYILEDFPNTTEQARLLLLALTGVDRTQRKPQPNDRASAFVPAKDAEFVDYDKSLAIFDGVVSVSPADPAEPYSYRVRCRRNLRDGSTVVLGDDCTSVDALADQFTPDMPHELLSVSLKLSSNDQPQLSFFLSELGVLKTSAVASHSEEAVEEAAAAVIAQLPQLLAPPAEPPAEPPVEGADTAEAPPAEEPEPAAVPPAVVESAAPAVVVNRLPGSVHPQVAKALAQFWATAEQQSLSETDCFFNAVRDVRYRVVQRRRCLMDALAKCTNRRDSKQALWDEFVAVFNSFDQDFRFDPDLKAELHLRALELRAQFWSLAAERKRGVEDVRVKIMADGALGVAVHCVQGSAAALVQSEINRFKTGMNVIQDYIKSVAAYKYTAAIVNTLEECAVPAEDVYDISTSGAALGAVAGKDGKAAAKPKGGKGEAKPLRTAVAPIVLSKEALLALPEPPALEDRQEEPAGKGKPAAKKGGKGKDEPAAAVSPLDAVEQRALALADYYSQESFTAARDVYEGNECVAEVIEAAVWHEAARLRFAVTKIKGIVTDVEAWLTQYEKEAGELAEQFIHQRYLRELACAQAVVARVVRAVEDFSPIRERWLLANDAMSVLTESLVLPLPVDPPQPVVALFPPNQFNEEQLGVVQDALMRLNLGGLVLLEDVDVWLQKASLPGAAPGNTFSSHGAGAFRKHLSNLSLPTAVLEHQDRVSEALNKEMMETQYFGSGVCPAAIISRTMAELVIAAPEPPAEADAVGVPLGGAEPPVVEGAAEEDPSPDVTPSAAAAAAEEEQPTALGVA